LAVIQSVAYNLPLLISGYC